jgi:hypothetical protein
MKRFDPRNTAAPGAIICFFVWLGSRFFVPA